MWYSKHAVFHGVYSNLHSHQKHFIFLQPDQCFYFSSLILAIASIAKQHLTVVLICISVRVCEIELYFSCTHWLFVYCMRSVYSGPLLTLKSGYLFSCYCIVQVSYVLWQLVLSQMCAVQILAPALRDVTLLYSCCCAVQNLWGSLSSLSLGLLCYMHLKVISKNSLLRLMLLYFPCV